MTHPSPEMLAELDGYPYKRHSIALIDRGIVAQSAFVLSSSPLLLVNRGKYRMRIRMGQPLFVILVAGFIISAQGQTPSYTTTSDWIASEFSQLGGETNNGAQTWSYGNFSMDSCDLRFLLTVTNPRLSTRREYIVTVPLGKVKDVTWQLRNDTAPHDGRIVLFTASTSAFTFNDDHRGFAELLLNRGDVDNSDLGPRLVKAFDNAVAICKAQATASTKPF